MMPYKQCKILFRLPHDRGWNKKQHKKNKLRRVAHLVSSHTIPYLKFSIPYLGLFRILNFPIINNDIESVNEYPIWHDLIIQPAIISIINITIILR